MEDVHIQGDLFVPARAISIEAIKGSGPGGQSVNKTNSTAQLHAFIDGFGWSEGLRDRVLTYRDSRISKSQRTIVIQVSSQRSFYRNRDEAVERLSKLLRAALHRQKPRLRTNPSRSSVRKAVKAQKRRSEIKALRGSVRDW